MAKIIYESELGDFLAELAKESKVYVPSPKAGHHLGQFAFRLWSPGVIFEPSYPVTLLPPTEFLLPQKETLFSFEGEKVSSAVVEPQILFGLSVEDLEGIEKLDKIMSAPVADAPYQKRRQKTYLVGLDKFSPNGVPFDLYLQEIEPGVYAATAKTTQGQRWLKLKTFRNSALPIVKAAPKEDPVLSDPELPKAIKASRQHPIWSELAEICFGCGICSYVCPLCYCSDTKDTLDFGEEGCGERCRSWDSCMLKSFADTTHHNFRPELSERIYNWYYHKFYRMPREQGFVGCVDCNRCAVYCPAKINFHRVLRQVLSDYQKRPKK